MTTRAYERDTLTLYARRLAPRVQRVVQELLRTSVIGEHEAASLLAPRAVAEAETVALRLIELGVSLGHPRAA